MCTITYGLLLEYIEWKVYLSEGNNFDPERAYNPETPL